MVGGAGCGWADNRGCGRGGVGVDRVVDTVSKPNPGTPEYDRGSISKLRAVKKANANEATVNRLQGKDGKHTRDGGTNRRNWR
jgi:hypothetical protein